MKRAPMEAEADRVITSQKQSGCLEMKLMARGSWPEERRPKRLRRAEQRVVYRIWL